MHHSSFWPAPLHGLHPACALPCHRCHPATAPPRPAATRTCGAACLEDHCRLRGHRVSLGRVGGGLRRRLQPADRAEAAGRGGCQSAAPSAGARQAGSSAEPCWPAELSTLSVLQTPRPSPTAAAAPHSSDAAHPPPLHPSPQAHSSRGGLEMAVSASSTSRDIERQAEHTWLATRSCSGGERAAGEMAVV